MNKKYRKAIIAGNWKMNMLASQVKGFVETLRDNLGEERSCDIVLCTPGVLVPALVATRFRRLGVGAQNVSEYEKGAHTGEVSADMLQDMNVRYCIVGHSERRQDNEETDNRVNAKVKLLMSRSITPIICVGESLDQRERNLTFEHIAYQVKAALFDVSPEQIRHCIIAYEPIWAIGTGRTATADEAQEVCESIREQLRGEYGARVSRRVSILYGGSMTPENAKDLLAMTDIDGGLIGGASLKAESFARIIAATKQD